MQEVYWELPGIASALRDKGCGTGRAEDGCNVVVAADPMGAV